MVFNFFVKKPDYEREFGLKPPYGSHQLLRSWGCFPAFVVKMNIRQVDEQESIFETHYE